LEIFISLKEVIGKTIKVCSRESEELPKNESKITRHRNEDS
jgi:hypothetical protein